MILWCSLRRTVWEDFPQPNLHGIGLGGKKRLAPLPVLLEHVSGADKDPMPRFRSSRQAPGLLLRSVIQVAIRKTPAHLL